MMYSVTATPLMAGSIMSSVTTSGRRVRHSSMACLPSSASPTTANSGFDARTSTRYLRVVSESSTTSTRVIDISLTNELPDHPKQRALIEFPLQNVRPRSGPLRSPTVFLGPSRRDHDRGNCAEQVIGLRARYELETIHSLHLDIDQKQAVLPFTCLEQALLTRGREVHLIARGFENALLEHPSRKRIINDKHWRTFKRGGLDARCLPEAGCGDQPFGVENQLGIALGVQASSGNDRLDRGRRRQWPDDDVGRTEKPVGSDSRHAGGRLDDHHRPGLPPSVGDRPFAERAGQRQKGDDLAAIDNRGLLGRANNLGIRNAQSPSNRTQRQGGHRTARIDSQCSDGGNRNRNRYFHGRALARLAVHSDFTLEPRRSLPDN